MRNLREDLPYGMNAAHFDPRPDDVERHDNQSSLYNSVNPGVSWMLHGQGSGGSSVAIAKAMDEILFFRQPRWT